MKTHSTTLKLFAAALALMLSTLCLAAPEEDIWSDERPRPERQMNPEQIEKMLDRIAEANPQAAEELRELHQNNPEEFQERVREMFRQRLQEMREQRPDKLEAPRGERGGFGPGPEGDDRGPKGKERRPDGPGIMPDRDGRRNISPEQMREKAQEHIDKYMNWLQSNYPDEYQALNEIREKDPKVFERRLTLSAKKYGRIMATEEQNPELAEVFKEDLALKERRDQILKELRGADESTRETLKAELEKIVGERFDIIVYRKQLQYDELRQRLEQLQNELAKRETEVQDLKNRKAEATQSRMNELLSEAERIDWD